MYWGFSVFVHADFDTTMQRVLQRDLYLFESPERIRKMYRQRYIPGEQIYLRLHQPADRADIMWNNNVIEQPELTYNRKPSGCIP